MVELILTVGSVVNVLGGTFLVAFAVFIATVRPRTWEGLAFALFAGGFGLWTALWNIIGRSDPLFPAFFSAAAAAAAISGVALIALVLRYPTPVRRDERRLLVLPTAVTAVFAVAVPAGLLLVPGAVETYLEFWRFDPAYRGAWTTWWVLAAALSAGSMLFALIVVPLRFPGEVRRARGLVPGFAAVSAVPMIYMGFTGASFFRAEDPSTVAFSVGVIATTVLASLLWLRCVAKGAAPRVSRNLALLAVAMPALGMLTATVSGGSVVTGVARTGAFGVIRTAAVVVLGYAVLRHHLFDVDVKVKWSIKQSTLAAIFIVVFFVVSEIAQVLFAQWFGGSLDDVQANIIGILAAGGLLFVLTPLQRFAERVGDAAMPDVKPVEEMTDDERLDTYRGQVEIA